MEKKSATELITVYMKEQRISIVQASKDLGIPEEKLRYKHGEELTAAEFLMVCRYADVLPEEIRAQQIADSTKRLVDNE